MSRPRQTQCKRGHPFDEANTHVFRDRTGRIRRVCRKCAKLRNPFRERLYGLSREQYAEMLVEQSSVCALCGKDSGDRALAVDHDHTSGSIRGLLCSTCNTGLGAFRDDPALLRRAINYLEAHALGQDPVRLPEPALSAADREQIAMAFDMVLDEFIEDVEQLARGQSFADTLMWTWLPDAFKERYNLGFAVRFLIGTATVRERLDIGHAYPATCVAEELALRAVLRTAIAAASETTGDVQAADRLETFADGVLPEYDFLLLFDGQVNLSRAQAQLLGATHLLYEDWFRPFSMSSPSEANSLN